MSCDLVASVAPPVMLVGGMCLDMSGRVTGSIVYSFMHITYFMHANDVSDKLLNYYNRSCKVQHIVLQCYNATTQYTISVGAGHAIGSANFKACAVAR